MTKEQGLHTAGVAKILLVSVTSNVINAVGISVNPVEHVAVVSSKNYLQKLDTDLQFVRVRQ